VSATAETAADDARLINIAVSPGVRAKQSNMPFVQRENISHFVRACQMPPFSLPDHDIFLTDDLYEAKDRAQVLQCIVAFSRRANAVNPSAFPRSIGARSKANIVSPQLSGTSQGAYARPPTGLASRDRGNSNASDSSTNAWNSLAKGSYSGRMSPTKASGKMSPPGNVSSWSKKGDEGSTAPAWNIHQYGYMGGASQGNQGISFGARRQITSANPSVPSLAEKERRRKEQENDAERQRIEAEEAEQKRRLEMEADEERARFEEEQRWQEESRKTREKERDEAEAEKRRWDEEQRRWKEEEEARLREERELEAQRLNERNRQHKNSDSRLRGQFLSQYQAEDRQIQKAPTEGSRSTSESQRIKDLERQLELAKERERQYQLERQERPKSQQISGDVPSNHQQSRPSPEQPRPRIPSKTSHEDDWQATERGTLRKEWEAHNDTGRRPQPALPQAPKPTPAEPVPAAQVKLDNDNSRLPPPPPRPLPDPAAYAPTLNRTDRYLSTNPAPAPAEAQSHRPADYSTTTEVDLENQRRKESQAKTKAGGWASKSLLEREMERERERQREWEEAQKQTVKTSRDTQEGAGPGQSWDVHQYGYLGGDSQNRGGPGLGVGGARRQIIGPRPPP
jgi:transgelin